MAIGKKSGGRDFQPGQSGNPAGRTPLPPELKETRRLNKTEFETLVNKYLWASFAQIEAASEDATLPAIERYVVSIIAKGIKTGDWGGCEWIAQRLIGKVQDRVEVTTPKPFVIAKRDGSTLELGAKVDSDDEAG